MKLTFTVFLIITFSISAISAPAEKTTEFDALYNQIVSEISLTDIERAIYLTDSLIKVTED